MPYANTGGGTRQSLTPAQTAGKKRKDKAQKVGKSIPHMLNLVNAHDAAAAKRNA